MIRVHVGADNASDNATSTEHDATQTHAHPHAQKQTKHTKNTKTTSTTKRTTTKTTQDDKTKNETNNTTDNYEEE